MKTRQCGTAEARIRLGHARKFLEVAQLYADENDADSQRVAVTNAVMAGIAAVDAVCCARLNERSASDNHADAAALVQSVGQSGLELSKALGRLVAIKNKAQYQIDAFSRPEVRAAVRRAETLVESAGQLVFSST